MENLLMSYEDIRARAEARRDLNDKIKRLLVEGLDLPVPAADIDDDQPLFGRGLELDSLDTLEIVSVIEDEFEVYLTDDDRYAFGSINKIADRVLAEMA